MAKNRNRNRHQAESVQTEEEALQGPAVEEMPAESEQVADVTAPAEVTASQSTEPVVYGPTFLGKYAPAVEKNGDVIPSTFKYRDMPLFPGIQPQERATKDGAPSRPSVRLRIFNMVKANPGITGSQLVELMREQDWHGHPSAYVKGEKVARSWCTDYITAQLRKKRGYLVTAPEAAITDADEGDSTDASE